MIWSFNKCQEENSDTRETECLLGILKTVNKLVLQQIPPQKHHLTTRDVFYDLETKTELRFLLLKCRLSTWASQKVPRPGKVSVVDKKKKATTWILNSGPICHAALLFWSSFCWKGFEAQLTVIGAFQVAICCAIISIQTTAAANRDTG